MHVRVSNFNELPRLGKLPFRGSFGAFGDHRHVLPEDWEYSLDLGPCHRR